MKRLSVGLCAALFLLGCTEPTPQAKVEENARAEISKRLQKPLEVTYGKVLKEDEIEAMNKCLSADLVSKLTTEEKLFLGGNTAEKIKVAKEADNVASKLLFTSNEFKGSLKTCSAVVGVVKAINKVK